MCVCSGNKIKSLKEKTGEKHVSSVAMDSTGCSQVLCSLVGSLGGGVVGGTPSRGPTAWPGPLWGHWP